MENYLLFTDATADIPAPVAEEMELVVIPMDFNLGGREYTHYADARELSIPAFYEALRAGADSKTVQINISRFHEQFEPALKAGRDILYICFSSALSGTYQTSLIAAQELRARYPQRKLIVVDSKAASIGEGVLAFAAARRRLAGMPLEELAAWVTANRDYAAHQFVVDDLDHLRRGGRISPLATVIGSALSIKPFLRVDMDGALFVRAKIRGRLRSMEALAGELAENYAPARDPVIFIGHGDCADDAKRLLETLLDRYRPDGRIVVAGMGPIIGSHTGANTLALAFMGNVK